MDIVQFRRGDQVPGGAVLAMDAYDGLHPGHLRIIEDARREAGRLGAPLSVFSMEPHPRRLLHHRSPPFTIITRDQEIRVLEQLGVERLYILTLNLPIIEMACAEFAAEILSEGLDVRHVSASTQAPFGIRGTPSGLELKAAGARLGFGVSLTPPAAAPDGDVFSSADVRRLVSEGRVREATERLGRPFAIRGAVEHGAKLGRTIGFPTANVALGDYVRPAPGIYASVSLLEDGRRLPGLSYIGRRPTVDDGEERLEVHLFNFDGDLYRQQFETALIEFLRPDEHFASFELMQVQMEKDRLHGRVIAFDALEGPALRT